MRDLLAAQWWGCLSPGAFDALEKRERVEIVALYEIKWRMDAVNTHEAIEKGKRGR